MPDGPSSYEIHASSMIDADGHTFSEVLVYGMNPDGTPAHDTVVLGASRAGSGQFVSPTLILDDLGGRTDFVPCNSTIAGCVGPLTLTAALSSAPSVPVAHVDVELVAPADVGSIEHCLGSANAVYLDGNDPVYSGMLTILDAGWASIGGTERAVVQVTPHNPIQGTNWTLQFETRQLQIPMAASVYEDAAMAPSEGPGHPGLSVMGSIGCNTITGRFQIHEFTPGTNSDVHSLTASFEQHCDGNPATMVSGCVHYQQ